MSKGKKGVSSPVVIRRGHPHIAQTAQARTESKGGRKEGMIVPVRCFTCGKVS